MNVGCVIIGDLAGSCSNLALSLWFVLPALLTFWIKSISDMSHEWFTLFFFQLFHCIRTIEIVSLRTTLEKCWISVWKLPCVCFIIIKHPSNFKSELFDGLSALKSLELKLLYHLYRFGTIHSVKSISTIYSFICFEYIMSIMSIQILMCPLSLFHQVCSLTILDMLCPCA